MKAYLPAYSFSHLRLNRFNSLQWKEFMQDVCPVDLFFFKIHKILHSIDPLEKMSIKKVSD